MPGEPVVPFQQYMHLIAVLTRPVHALSTIGLLMYPLIHSFTHSQVPAQCSSVRIMINKDNYYVI